VQIVPLNPESPHPWILEFRNIMFSALFSHPSVSLRSALPPEVCAGVTGSWWVAAASLGKPVAAFAIIPTVLYGSAFSEAFLCNLV